MVNAAHQGSALEHIIIIIEKADVCAQPGLYNFPSEAHHQVADKTARRLHDDNRDIQVWMKPFADLGDPKATSGQTSTLHVLEEHRAKLRASICGFVREKEAQGRVSMFPEAAPNCLRDGRQGEQELA